MLRYVPPSALTEEQLALLVESWATDGGTELQVAEAVASGHWMVFEVHGGILAVSKIAQTLVVQALHVRNFGWFMRQFYHVMIRLAADWHCNTVETFCFDERLAAAMLRIKGKHAATLVRWQVSEGQEHGRQDQDDADE